jgi:hypothetical protein
MATTGEGSLDLPFDPVTVGQRSSARRTDGRFIEIVVDSAWIRALSTTI